jgi:hypothetical protein
MTDSRFYVHELSRLDYKRSPAGYLVLDRHDCHRPVWHRSSWVRRDRPSGEWTTVFKDRDKALANAERLNES